MSKILIAVLFCFFSLVSQGQIAYYSHDIFLHSHNDYNQALPLYGVLKMGFQSIEVDIILDNGLNKVSHDDKRLEDEPTLEDLYLRPLYDAYQARESIETGLLFLMLDIKRCDEDFLDRLDNLVRKYADVFCTRGDASCHKIRILLSGEIDRTSLIQDHSYSFFFVDGRLDNLGIPRSTKVMPIISVDMRELAGRSTRYLADKRLRAKILKIAVACHNEAKLVRFWNTPDHPHVWGQLIALGVDVIGTDEHETLVSFLSRISH